MLKVKKLKCFPMYLFLNTIKLKYNENIYAANRNPRGP